MALYIKTKCFSVLNEKVENINQSGNNRLGNNQNINKHHIIEKNRNKVHSSTYKSEARIKMHEKPRRPSTHARRPKSASHTRGCYSASKSKAMNRRSNTPITSRRRLVRQSGPTLRGQKRPSSAKA